ncbi:unnamed protein product [Closterium sp. Naga37s-1]|nr:unnamed protein product [Closterium sp. Naga37s-1]
MLLWSLVPSFPHPFPSSPFPAFSLLLFLPSAPLPFPDHQYIQCPVSTLCVGQAASMVTLLLAAGEAGQRRSLPNARLMYIQCPVSTLCVGQATSMATLLLAAGEAGQRRSLPNARLMVHQPSGGAQGQATDIAIHAEEIIKTKGRLNGLYAKHTGKEVDVIAESMERDRFMSPTEALTFGLIDEVIDKRPAALVTDGVK